MVTKEKLVDWFCCSIYTGLILFFVLMSIVLSVISCVAETRVQIEMIKTGKVPTEVSYEK